MVYSNPQHVGFKKKLGLQTDILLSLYQVLSFWSFQAWSVSHPISQDSDEQNMTGGPPQVLPLETVFALLLPSCKAVERETFLALCRACFFLPNCIRRRSSPRFVAGEVGAAKWSAGNSASEETEGIASALSESGSGLAPILSDGFGGSNLDQRSTWKWSTQFYTFRYGNVLITTGYTLGFLPT